MSMLFRTAFVLVAVFAFQANLFSEDPADKPKLEGQHQVIAMEQNGAQLKEADFKGATIRFTDDKLVGANKDGTEFMTANYKVDTSQKPCRITVTLTSGTNNGKQLQGLVERKEDTIRVILSNEGADKPTEFKTKQNQVMYTLKAESK